MSSFLIRDALILVILQIFMAKCCYASTRTLLLLSKSCIGESLLFTYSCQCSRYWYYSEVFISDELTFSGLCLLHSVSRTTVWILLFPVQPEGLCCI